MRFTMCKIGKKIIINIFGSTEDMKKKETKKKFCDLAVSRTNEKKKE